ncbi:EcoKI restriction-modification system protein HsdS [Bacillus cereus]|nr:EcoKI restriction-modification system protein HsdS [Bacillus cereus]
MKNKYTPEIRFSGFSGDWEQCKLGEVSTFINGRAYKQHELLNSGKYKVLRVGNFYTNDSWYYSNLELGEKYYAEKGDLLYTWSATFGPHIWYGDKVIYHYHIWKMDLSDKLDKQFIVQLLEYDKAKITSDKNGSTMVHITKKGMEEKKVLLPLVDEQTKIGNLFKQIDNTIALHQQELTTLKQTKQGFLQKMFPKEGESVPDVRFPGFTGDWEQRKLDSMVDRLKSYSLSRDVETNDYTGYKYIHYGDIHKKVADIIDESSNLPNIKAGNYELLEKGDLVLADASEDYQGIATPAVITIDMPYKLVSGLHTIALRPKQVDSLFLYYLINSPIFRKYGYRVGTGMKVFGISVTNLLKFESIFPSLEEQTKIGNFFKQLDNTIALHQRELDTLKETKKAFLQKMFV